MPITPIPDLNAGRKLATELSLTLARQADGSLAVFAAGAVLAGEVVIRNFSGEDLYPLLTATQQNIVKSLMSAAEGKIKLALGL